MKFSFSGRTLKVEGIDIEFMATIEEAIQCGDVIAVSISPDNDQRRNVFGVKDGNIIWQIGYVPGNFWFGALRCEEGKLKAYHGNGWIVTVDLETGEIIEKRETR